MPDLGATSPCMRNTDGPPAGGTASALARPALTDRLYETARYLSRSWELYVFILPAVVHIFLFKYLPIYGLSIAFTDGFSLRTGRSAPEWNNFAHFLRFFDSAFFVPVIRNTVVIALYSLATWPIALVLALMMNEARNRHFQKAVQMATYAPYFISTVVVVSMLTVFLSPRIGVINSFIKLLGGEPIFFMASPSWGPTLFVLSELWQNAGFGAIIYLAALSAVDPQLREAAFCDGAHKLRIIWHVDLPWITPTIVILFIMRLGQLLTIGFEKVLLMQNNLNITTMEVVSTYVYRSGIQQAQYDYATAVGLLETVANFALLVIANRLARHFGQTSLW